ncbi:MAG: UDP-N-acetylmuramate dehydrogenase [Jatrophihabitans sp.]|nr:MAG: UDP-N-acetylmuramate dehydrogenase [Jatrophihabitans sp.]
MPTLLADLTTLRLGGPAARVVTAGSSQELTAAVRAADRAGDPVLVVAGGSNLVVADAGWPGTVVLLRCDVAPFTVRDDGDRVLVTVQPGAVWDDLVAASVENGWSGLAAMSGIPGTAGATPVQNVGAYGSEVADVLQSVSVLDRYGESGGRRGVVETWTPQRCAFGFRTSAFKHTDRYVVLEVTLALARASVSGPVRYLEVARRLGIEPGGTAPNRAVRETVLDLRRSKGMVLDAADHDTWSVGSFFVNPFVTAELVPEGCPNFTVDGGIKLPAGWLIENAGFARGYGLDRGRGTVAISTKHTLALTNRGGATTAELLALAAEIRVGVQERFGIRLRPEAHLAGVEL